MENNKVEKDFYSIQYDAMFSKSGIVTFKFPEQSDFPKMDYDWYIIVALEKADKVSVDRHLLTKELIVSYRWAIREGYQHQLDGNLKREYDYPRNQNTIKGIQGYIDKIKKLSEKGV